MSGRRWEQTNAVPIPGARHLSVHLAELAAKLGDTCELRAMWLDRTACTTSTVEVRPSRDGVVFRDLVCERPGFYLHSAKILRRRGSSGVAASRKWTDPVPIGRVDLGPEFLVPAVNNDRYAFEIEYDGPEEHTSFHARLNSRDGSIGYSIGVHADRVRYTGTYGKSLVLALDQWLVTVAERRAGEIGVVGIQALTEMEMDHGYRRRRELDDASIAGRGAMQRLPRPIAVRRLMIPMTHRSPSDCHVELVTGYDDERGWMFAFGRRIGDGGPVAIIEMNPAGYTPAWAAGCA